MSDWQTLLTIILTIGSFGFGLGLRVILLASSWSPEVDGMNSVNFYKDLWKCSALENINKTGEIIVEIICSILGFVYIAVMNFLYVLWIIIKFSTIKPFVALFREKGDKHDND